MPPKAAKSTASPSVASSRQTRAQRKAATPGPKSLAQKIADGASQDATITESGKPLAGKISSAYGSPAVLMPSHGSSAYGNDVHSAAAGALKVLQKDLGKTPSKPKTKPKANTAADKAKEAADKQAKDAADAAAKVAADKNKADRLAKIAADKKAAEDQRAAKEAADKAAEDQRAAQEAADQAAEDSKKRKAARAAEKKAREEREAKRLADEAEEKRKEAERAARRQAAAKDQGQALGDPDDDNDDDPEDFANWDADRMADEEAARRKAQEQYLAQQQQRQDQQQQAAEAGRQRRRAEEAQRQAAVEQAAVGAMLPPPGPIHSAADLPDLSSATDREPGARPKVGDKRPIDSLFESPGREKRRKVDHTPVVDNRNIILPNEPSVLSSKSYHMESSMFGRASVETPALASPEKGATPPDDDDDEPAPVEVEAPDSATRRQTSLPPVSSVDFNRLWETGPIPFGVPTPDHPRQPSTLLGMGSVRRVNELPEPVSPSPEIRRRRPERRLSFGHDTPETRAKSATISQSIQGGRKSAGQSEQSRQDYTFNQGRKPFVERVSAEEPCLQNVQIQTGESSRQGARVSIFQPGNSSSQAGNLPVPMSAKQAGKLPAIDNSSQGGSLAAGNSSDQGGQIQPGKSSSPAGRLPGRLPGRRDEQQVQPELDQEHTVLQDGSSPAGPTVLAPLTRSQAQAVQRQLAQDAQAASQPVQPVQPARPGQQANPVQPQQARPDEPDHPGPYEYLRGVWDRIFKRPIPSIPWWKILYWIGGLILTLLLISGLRSLAGSSWHLSARVPSVLRHPVTSFTNPEYSSLKDTTRRQGFELKHLSDEQKSLSQATKKLEEILPKVVSVKQDKKTSKLVIGQEFWHALKDLVSADSEILTIRTDAQGYKNIAPDHFQALMRHLETHNLPTPSTWQNWLRANSENAKRAMGITAGQSLGPNDEKKLDKMIEDKLSSDGLREILVPREEFISEIQTQLGRHTQELESDMATMRQKLDHLTSAVQNAATAGSLTQEQATTLIDAAVKKAMTNLRLQAGAKGSIKSHLELSLKTRPNYFGFGNGAIVGMDISSPTFNPPPRHPLDFGSLNWKNQQATKFEKDHFAALLKWEDAGECWCGGGKVTNKYGMTDHGTHTKIPVDADHPVDIHVLLQTPVVPEYLAIEHIDPTATLDSDSMPKDIEIWVSGVDLEDTRRTHLRDFMTAQWPDLDLEAEHSLFKQHGFLKVGGFTYEHDRATDGVQVYKFSGELGRMDVKTDSVVVRAATNHGADHTCFYRVRFYGSAGGEE